MEVAGAYNGIEYSKCEVSMYTDVEENAAVVGNIVVYNDKEEIEFDGELTKVMDNYYELTGTDITVSVYTDNGNLNLDMYKNGEHLDYFVMVEHYES